MYLSASNVSTGKRYAAQLYPSRPTSGDVVAKQELYTPTSYNENNMHAHDGVEYEREGAPS